LKKEVDLFIRENGLAKQVQRMARGPKAKEERSPIPRKGEGGWRQKDLDNLGGLLEKTTRRGMGIVGHESR